jgi:hypothetical protein
LFAADGCFYIDKKRYHYTLSISLSENQLQYARMMQHAIGELIGKQPRMGVKRKMVQLVVRGKPLFAFLKHFLTWRGRKAHSIHFKDSALQLCEGFLRGVPKGLVAGDGNAYPPKRLIAFGVVSRKLAIQFGGFLSRFGIPSNRYSVPYEGKKTLHHVHVTRQRNLEKFKLRVGLTDPTKSEQLNLALRR